MSYNIVDKGPFPTKPVPIERSHSGLFIGTIHSDHFDTKKRQQVTKWYDHCETMIFTIGSQIVDQGIVLLTSAPCNFVNINRIITNLVSIESPEWELSIGAGFVKIRAMLIML